MANAIKFGTGIDLAKSPLNNAQVQNLSADPSSPVLGQEYFNTTSNKIRTFNGTTWDEYGTSTASGTVTGVSVVTANGFAGTVANPSTTPAITLQATQAGIQKSNGTALSAATQGTDYYAPGGTDVAVADGGTGASTAAGAITNLGAVDISTAQTVGGVKTFSVSPSVPTPTNPTDAANKGYVDSYAQGLDYKISVQAATTTNGTLASSFANGSVVDGVTLATGNRILIKNQTTAADNGIYTVNASGAPTRATDADVTGELTSGALTYVEAGTVNGTQLWVLTTTGTITLGTTAQSWTQFSGASTLTAGSGLVSSGNVFNVGAGTGIVVNTDNVTLDRSTNSATVPFKYVGTIGDGTSTSIGVSHGLGVQYVHAQVFDATSNAQVFCDIVLTSASVTTFNFNTAPTTGQYRVVIVG